MHYIALIHKDADSDYGVSFPDFPGCITAGSTIEEAKDMAAEALQGHIDCMADIGEIIPSSMPLDDVMKEKENKDAIAFMLNVDTPHDKYVKVNITMPESLMLKTTAYAKSQGQSRSAFIAETLKSVLPH